MVMNMMVAATHRHDDAVEILDWFDPLTHFLQYDMMIVRCFHTRHDSDKVPLVTEFIKLERHPSFAQKASAYARSSFTSRRRQLLLPGARNLSLGLMSLVLPVYMIVAMAFDPHAKHALPLQLQCDCDRCTPASISASLMWSKQGSLP